MDLDPALVLGGRQAGVPLKPPETLSPAREDKSKLPEEQRTRFKWWFENLSRDLAPKVAPFQGFTRPEGALLGLL